MLSYIIHKNGGKIIASSKKIQGKRTLIRLSITIYTVLQVYYHNRGSERLLDRTTLKTRRFYNDFEVL